MQKRALLFFILLSFLAKASHNRSGEITYKRVAPFTKISGSSVVQAYWYAITVTKYTDDDTQLKNSTGNNEVADRCIDTLYFGDGSSQFAFRSNGGTPVCTGCEGCGCSHCGELIIKEADYRVKKNIYEFLHEYPGPGSYLMRTSDPNRNADVINMLNSDQQLFYLESLLVINSFSGPNNSPVFTVDPIDKACQGKCFTHNPGAYDSDHDSISYKMSTPKTDMGVTVAGYFNPPAAIFNINELTGTLTWCNPDRVGEYNIAFIVQEWRKNTSGSPQLIGTVLRDMQVVVRACPTNDPPVIVVPQDTCVEAGTLIQKKIKVSDPNISNVVTLSGYGGAFSASNPKATLSNISGNGFSANFSWQTSCEHISQQLYRTTFKAEDNAGSLKLASFNVYSIRVVPSSVKNVTAVPFGSYMNVTWSLSNCNPASNPIMAYQIYRSEGCAAFVNDPCKNGVSPASGFLLIGETTNTVTAFVDNNGGDGLVVGESYSYLVIAVYKDGSQSFGNSLVCAKLKRDVPIILNVDVQSTSASNGSIKVRWSRPLKTAGNFDTLAYPGPYRFDLKYKANGIYNTIFTSTANLLYQLDTQYVHTPVNSTLDSNEYIIDFTATGKINIGSSQKATSVFLSAIGSDRKVDLSWKSKTPWKNYKYTIYRKDPSATTFNVVGTTTTTSFTDQNHVVNKNSYCYYVLAEGQYSDPTIYKPLLNNSQQVCVTPVDLTPPCTPTLSIDADCPSGFVTVSWKNVRSLCSDDVLYYILYYKPTIDGTYQRVFETDSTYYPYDGLGSISGCYAIQAKDSVGNLSVLSPDFCIDNCPEFELPNIFSPNKDGINDFYKAIRVRQVKEIDLAIVDRWGNLVYKTKDPYFQWDGVSLLSKESISEGTFFYVCTVYESRVKGIVKRVLKGNIQVVR